MVLILLASPDNVSGEVTRCLQVFKVLFVSRKREVAPRRVTLVSVSTDVTLSPPLTHTRMRTPTHARTHLSVRQCRVSNQAVDFIIIIIRIAYTIILISLRSA